MEILLPASMVILHWILPMAVSTTRPSQELEVSVLYTLFTFVGVGAGLDGMAAKFAGSP